MPGAREVKRSETKRAPGRRPQRGIMFRNRADSPGATTFLLRLEHLGRTRAPANRPQSMARGETAPRAPVQKLPGIAVWLAC